MGYWVGLGRKGGCWCAGYSVGERDCLGRMPTSASHQGPDVTNSQLSMFNVNVQKIPSKLEVAPHALGAKCLSG